MKRFLPVVLVIFLMGCILAGCGSTVKIDYESAADFESALNNGEDLTGKVVKFTVNTVVPDSAFGYNLESGNHLNFCSTSNPGVEEGDIVTAKVTKIQSVLGSYIISYEMLDKSKGTGNSNPESSSGTIFETSETIDTPAVLTTTTKTKSELTSVTEASTASTTIAETSIVSTTIAESSAVATTNKPTQAEISQVDYLKVEDFENALNNGEDLTGKTVTFTVKAFVPDSAFGYNLQAGEHLNFCSAAHPGATVGDTVTVKVVEINSMMGSYIISYEAI